MLFVLIIDLSEMLSKWKRLSCIADNLRIAKPNATDKEIAEALKAEQCSDIIARLPQRINTVIGSEGTYLSGGKQQRRILVDCFPAMMFKLI